jgi:hypothetical protein
MACLMMTRFFVFCSISLALFVLQSGYAQQMHTNKPVNTYAGQEFDCTDFQIEQVKKGELTKEERIAALDDAFYQSVDRYQVCSQQATAQQQNPTASGGASAAAGGGASGGQGTSNEQTDQQQEQGQEQRQQTEQTTSVKNTQTTVTQDETLSQGPGRTPEDIPPVDNDSVLQRQIREAAMAEKDPEKRRKLWELYRKYKGEQDN